MDNPSRLQEKEEQENKREDEQRRRRSAQKWRHKEASTRQVLQVVATIDQHNGEAGGTIKREKMKHAW